VGTPSTPYQIGREIVRRLLALGDRATAGRAQTFNKQPLQFIGVRAADMRLIAREIYGSIKKQWLVGDAVQLCDILLPDKRLEVKAVAVLVLARFAKLYPEDLHAIIQDWIEEDYCDSWAIIDCLCGEVVSPLLGNYPELVQRLSHWRRSPNMWLRRAAAVALTKHARRGLFLDQAYALAMHLMQDQEDLVLKGCGWLLKEAGKTDSDRLEAFLLHHGSLVRRTALRYAIELFPPERRQRILIATK